MPTMRCKHCRYRLTGLADNRCPECGREFDPNDPTTFEEVPQRPRNSVFVALGVFVGPPIGYCLGSIAWGEPIDILSLIATIVGSLIACLIIVGVEARRASGWDQKYGD